MGFDDFYENGHKHNHNGYGHHEHDDYHRSSHSRGQHYNLKYQLLYKLQNDPRFRTIILVAAVVLTAILIFTVILLLPLITKLFHYLSSNGIQGLIDIIWKGTN